MKKLPWIGLVVLAMAIKVGPLNAAEKRKHEKKPETFEGKVDYKIFAGNFDELSAKWVIYTKGSKIRIDTNTLGQKGESISDSMTQKIITVIPNQKMFLVSNLPPATNGPMNGSFADTGNRDVFLGHRVEEWVLQQPNYRVTFWFATDMGPFMNPTDMMGFSQMPKEIRDAMAKGLFPLKATIIDGAFPIGFNAVATNIEKKDLDEDVFEAPDDFKKVDAPNLLAGGSPSLSITITSQGVISQ
jgi:hypothetical protein